MNLHYLLYSTWSLHACLKWEFFHLSDAVEKLHQLRLIVQVLDDVLHHLEFSRIDFPIRDNHIGSSLNHPTRLFLIQFHEQALVDFTAQGNGINPFQDFFEFLITHFLCLRQSLQESPISRRYVLRRHSEIKLNANALQSQIGILLFN